MNLTLKLNLTTLYQALLWLAGICGFALTQDLVPPPYRAYVAIPVALAAAAASLKLHRAAGKTNPDGTDAALPYGPDLPALVEAAQAGFESYRMQAGGKSLATGEAIPEWAQLAPAIQVAWRAAAAGVKAAGTR
jgi:hypothetical protein